MKALNLVLRASGLSVAILLSACGGSDDDDNDGEIRELEARIEAIDTRLMVIDEGNISINDRLDAIEGRLDGLDSESDELAEIIALLDRLDEEVSILEAGIESVYEITIVNTTANQPLAPAAVILHDDSYYGWSLGSPASVGLETLAESGSPADFLSEASDVFDSTASGDVLMPGMNTEVTLATVWRADLSLTLASMPVNTNDAFAGANGLDISGLAEGETLKALLHIYDAGTEANTESSGTVPGPAAGGEGFNAVRDDLVDAVALHRGVVTADDGYEDSALDQSHRFDQGAILLSVTRIN